MNSFGSQKRFLFAVSSEEMRGGADRRGLVVCPKPRRSSQFAGTDPALPLPFNNCYQQESCDAKASAELLEIFLQKGGESNQIPSSPPFFCGSPPCRASNPLVHDARFLQPEGAIASFMSTPFTSSPLSSNLPMDLRKGCVVPAKYGFEPAAMRIEGFDCLNRDQRSCGITAIA